MPQTPRKRRTESVQSPYFSPQKNASAKHPPDPPCLTIDDLRKRLIELKPRLIQESVSDNPWKLLVAVTLLNKTTAKVALPVFSTIMSTWSTPWALSQASEPDLVNLLRPLGTYNVRAKRLIDLSRMYLQDPPSFRDERPSRANGTPISSSSGRKRNKYPPTPISHLPGAGPYALDSYRIFAFGPDSQEWKSVDPSDKELIRYLKWRWAAEEQTQWEPGRGVIGVADRTYIATLVSELELSLVGKNSPVSPEREAPSPLARSEKEG